MGLWDIILNRYFPQYTIKFVFVNQEIPDKIMVIRPNLIIIHESLQFLEDEKTIIHMLRCSIDALYPNAMTTMFKVVRNDNPAIIDEVTIQKMAIDALFAQGLSPDKILGLYMKLVVRNK
jgi:hypothetical protein